MLRGEKVILRAETLDDVKALHEIRSTDVDLHMLSSGRQWRPEALEDVLRNAAKQTPGDATGDARFTVETTVDVPGLPAGSVIGNASLFEIDLHQRCATFGMRFLAVGRGHGFGTEALRLLCDYGFRIRGLHRLQCDTLARNGPMIAVATKVGFRQEVRMREAGWVDGQWDDLLLFGLLAEEWKGLSDAAR
jgi:RimJ/RimL family protein N-acetyltransferase